MHPATNPLSAPPTNRPPNDTAALVAVQHRPAGQAGAPQPVAAARHHEAEAWCAVVSHRLGEQSGCLLDVADALADHADEHGQVIDPTVDRVMVWAGRPRKATRRALSQLVAGGLLRGDDRGTWLTAPAPGHDHARDEDDPGMPA